MKKQIPDLDEKKVKVGKLRPNAMSTQSASISLEADTAELIVARKRIRIGMVSCSVEKMLDIRKCSRCWTYDHAGNECSGPDRSKLCLNCGKEGHQAKACTEEVYCLICDEQGHSANTGRCGAFKKALKTARRAEKTSGTLQSQVSQN